ncbi:MAG TPA: hypothetical protein VJ206_07460 [bacterium]|nr:hypothetical protein [bacterium]
MPPTIEIRDPTKVIEITCSNGEGVSWNVNARFEELYEQIDAWHTALPMTSLKWENLPPDGTTALYQLTCQAVDGRTWDIKVGLRPGLDAPMFSFNVTDRFEEQEFSPQRLMRDTLIALTREYQVTLVEVTWV